MATKALALTIIIHLSLHASTLTIKSDYATGARVSNGFELTHRGKVNVHSNHIKSLTCNRLTLHLDKNSGTCQRVTATNAHLCRQNQVLNADRIHLFPKKNLLTACGNVVTQKKIGTEKQITTRARQIHIIG